MPGTGENGKEVKQMRQKLILTKPEFVMAWRLWQFGFALPRMPRIGAEIRELRIDRKKAPAAEEKQRGAMKEIMKKKKLTIV